VSEARRTPQRLLLPESSIALLEGVGPKRAAIFEAAGLHTIRELLYHLPARYEDWRDIQSIHEVAPGVTVTVAGELSALSGRPMPRAFRRRLVTAKLTDGAGDQIRMVWFNLPAYMHEKLQAGRRVIAHGKVSAGQDGGREMVHPELYFFSDQAQPPALRAVYGSPAGQIGQRLFAKLVNYALAEVGDRIGGAVPAHERNRLGLAPLGEALRYLHNPPNHATLDELNGGRTDAHRALAFDEMFAFQLALAIERNRAIERAGIEHGGDNAITGKFLESIPFPLTNSQSRAISEIECGMARTRQMNRILMGDVGSGKTVVAMWAALRAVECGHQAAFMAPTELLAEQHYRTFEKLSGGFGVAAGFLSGKVTGAKRSALLEDLAGGRINLVFGTHALIQNEVRFRDLSLAIIDEQHRFGVFERARLKDLGPCADMLLMTATPIPRSLTHALFANLEVSTLDELPAGRAPITTKIFSEDQLEEVNRLVRREVEQGHRAYYVLPLIEAEEDDDEPSVATTAEQLRAGALSGLRLGTIHGRMKHEDKERVMRQFRDGALDVLVATTVIEVGIDVPQATAMVVIAAERYGLAQLHQLRGRVGRGSSPSWCLLVASRDARSDSRSRLEILARTSSGAEIARADLELRGPGDLLGARQAGPLPLRFAGFIHDLSLIEDARALAEEYLAGDPKLEASQARGARAALRRMLEAGFSLGDVG
jgi:ATP-dependent DNA helicase RecG